MGASGQLPVALSGIGQLLSAQLYPLVCGTLPCTVVIASLKMFANLTHEKQHVVVLNFINLVASEVEHFFLVLLINFISFFVNLLSVSFSYGVCLCVCVCAQVHIYLCEGQWLVPYVFLDCSLPYFLSQGLSPNLKLLGLPRLSWPISSRGPAIFAFSVLALETVQYAWLLRGCWESEFRSSHLHTLARTLPLDWLLSPSPVLCLFLSAAYW